MKKTLFTAIFLVTLLFPTAPTIQAQTIDIPATTAQVDELRTTLIALLTQLIAQLQAQITELIAQQAVTDQNLGAISTKVDTVVANTTVAPAPTPTPLSVTLGEPYCNNDHGNGDTIYPLIITGKWSEGLREWLNPNSQFYSSRFIFSPNSLRIISVDPDYLREDNLAIFAITIDGTRFEETVEVTKRCPKL